MQTLVHNFFQTLPQKMKIFLSFLPHFETGSVKEGTESSWRRTKIYETKIYCRHPLSPRRNRVSRYQRKLVGDAFYYTYMYQLKEL